MTLPRILLVDDEPMVLEAIRLHLRKQFDVTTAPSGSEALRHIEAGPPFEVVLSDLRMPGMDGATFLAKARERAPDTTRLLLTGNSDVMSASRAVNQGHLFRFLTKPCPPDELTAALRAGVEQHRLVTSERVLLEQTLSGAVRALSDVLALANPAAFGRAARVKAHAARTAAAMKLPNAWAIEVAALLSQVGAITLPPATAERHYQGQPLSAEEHTLVGRLPRLAADLVGPIPRLELVRELLAAMDRRMDEPGAPPPVGARVLKVALDYDALETAGETTVVAGATLRASASRYDPAVLEAFLTSLGVESHELHEVPFWELRPGMRFADDLRTASGLLLIARGHEVTQSLLVRLRNFSAELPRSLRMTLRAEADESSEAEAGSGGLTVMDEVGLGPRLLRAR